MMKQLFKIRENNTDVRTEVVAGMTTFLTMVYIVVVNPAFLSAAVVPFEQVFMATVITAVTGTLIMGLFANYPIAIAPGMGINAYFTSVVLSQGVSYQVVFGTVFLAGILFFILCLNKIREVFLNAFIQSLKFGIISGICLFISFLCLFITGIFLSCCC